MKEINLKGDYIMNETLKLYEGHLEMMNKHLDDTMKEIEHIQQKETGVLDKDSKDLIALLMEHYSRMNTSVKCFSYEVRDFKKKISRREEA